MLKQRVVRAGKGVRYEVFFVVCGSFCGVSVTFVGRGVVGFKIGW